MLTYGFFVVGGPRASGSTGWRDGWTRASAPGDCALGVFAMTFLLALPLSR